MCDEGRDSQYRGAALSEAKQIKKAAGWLGVMTQGMGAVATTFFVETDLVKRGLAEAVGSLTQFLFLFQEPDDVA
jgi:hypothetical protein